MENKKIYVPALAYDHMDNIWKPADFQSDHTKVNGVKSLTFCTYNVWFEPHNFEIRGIELRKIMQETNADFICLQEVTFPFFKELLLTKWVQDSYFISGIQITSYHTVILSKHPCQFICIPFPTRMGRYLLYALIEINGIKTAVGTVHLESLNSAKVRKEQLDITFNEFKQYPRAFILGDHNFDWDSENKNIIPEHMDTWKVLHPDDPGYTMAKTPKYPAWRPDRILIKKDAGFTPIMIERLGMNPIPKYDHTKPSNPYEIKTPSDHYGLEAIVELDENFSTEKLIQESKETKKEDSKMAGIIWIDPTIDSQQNQGYTAQLFKYSEEQKADFASFDNLKDGIKYILANMKNYGSLKIITDLKTMQSIRDEEKESVKSIEETLKDNVKAIVFTNFLYLQQGKQASKDAGFSKCFALSSIKDVISSL